MDLLLDSHSLLFRAHYALPPMNTADGTPTSALYGFSVLLIKLLRENQPAGVAFAADTGAARARVERYPAYKAGRPPMPDGLAGQLRRFFEIPVALGMPVHRAPPELEADDVLASAAARSGDALVVSGDRDLLQLAGDGVDVLFVGQRARDHIRYDRAAVIERYGVEPERLPTITALVGDSSDNLPGLGGVGVKTAARWVREHRDIAGIVAAADRLKPARLQDAVREAAESLALSEELATLRRDLELDEPLVAPLTAAGLERLAKLFEGLEVKSLIPRLEALVPRPAIDNP
jgi:DNA polymerase-1